MATLTQQPITNGMLGDVVSGSVDLATTNTRGGAEWSIANLSGSTVSDTGTFSATTTVNAQYATKPATGNLLVIVITLQSNTRLSGGNPPSGWTKLIDAGATGRAIVVVGRRQDGNVNAATNITSTFGSNVTGTWTAIDFGGPADGNCVSGASSANGLESWTSSVASDQQAPGTRASADWPTLRLSIVALTTAQATSSTITVSGGDTMSSGSPIIGSSTRHAIAWDPESATATDYAATNPTNTTWSWSTNSTGSDVIVEFPGVGVAPDTATDQLVYRVGAQGVLGYGVHQAGAIFDCSAIGTDTITSANFKIKAKTNLLATTSKKIELIAGKIPNGASISYSTTKWAQVYDGQNQLPGTVLGSMTGANITANTTASSASFNDFNGSNGLNGDTALKSAISRTQLTSLRLIAEENRTTFTTSGEYVDFHGNGVVGTADDPQLVVVYAPYTANATVAAATVTANTAPIQAKPTAGVGTATGTGRTVTITGQPTATVATITTAGQTASAAVSSTATAGTVTGSGYDPAVSTSGSGTTATAGAAATTSASYDGTATIGAAAGVSATTSAGQNAAGQNAPTGIVAAGTATGQTAASALTSTATVAAGTAAGQTATSDHTSTSIVAAGTAIGQTAASDLTSTATVATGSGTALSAASQATVAALAGTVTGNGYDPAVSAGSGTVTATAETAITAGAGYDPQPSLSTQAASSSATVAGLTVTGLLAAGPNTAAIGADSYQPSPVAATIANLAAVTVTTPPPSGAVGTTASAAAVNTAGFTTTQQVQVAAQTATGTVAAFAGTVFVGQTDPHPTFLILDYATGGSVDVDTFAVSDHLTVARSDLLTHAVCDGTDRTVLE